MLIHAVHVQITFMRADSSSRTRNIETAGISHLFPETVVMWHVPIARSEKLHLAGQEEGQAVPSHAGGGARDLYSDGVL